MTARDLIQTILMATTEKEIKEYGGDPLDTEVLIEGWRPLRENAEVRTLFGKPIIVLFEDEGD